jgi:hypothetical protein
MQRMYNRQNNKLSDPKAIGGRESTIPHVVSTFEYFVCIFLVYNVVCQDAKLAWLGNTANSIA